MGNRVELMCNAAFPHCTGFIGMNRGTDCERIMQDYETDRTAEPRKRPRRNVINLLLVGNKDEFKDQASDRLFKHNNFRVVARSSSLVESMACVNSGAIDMVLLSEEFREEELTLFTFDARRRGFAGLILRAPGAGKLVAESKLQDNQPIQVGDFFIDVASRRIWIRGAETRCTPLEFELLKFLCKHPEELVSHGVLLESLWGNQAASPQILRVLVRAVRAKVEITLQPRYIVTQRKFGYRFIPAPPPLL